MGKIAKETGWVSLGFLGKLALKIGFDLVRDLVVDLMHLCMVLIKDLAYVTAGVIAKVRAFKPSHNRLSRYFEVNTWAAGMFVDHMLYDFRLNVPPVFSTGRRFARDVRDGSICSWTAEECLNFARITWRWFFQQFYKVYRQPGPNRPGITGCGGGSVGAVRGMAIPRHGSEWAVTLIGRLQSKVRALCAVPKEPPHKW